MIAVDTSALMAIVLGERQADTCAAALEAADEIVVSAATAAEALIVAARRNVAEEMTALLDGLGFSIEAVEPAAAPRIAAAYARWGKRNHPAGLNFGDCFAYALAKDLNMPLLFKGGDFARTDVRSALPDRSYSAGTSACLRRRYGPSMRAQSGRSNRNFP